MSRTTGAFSGRGSYGGFWSSGAYSGINARYLHFYGAYVWPENNDAYKTNGFSVRKSLNFIIISGLCYAIIVGFWLDRS